MNSSEHLKKFFMTLMVTIYQSTEL